MYSERSEDINITRDDVDRVILFLRQEGFPLSIKNEIFNFLCKEIFIFKLLQKEILKCPYCNNIVIGIKNLAYHIMDNHQNEIKECYYNIKLEVRNLNRDPSNLPKRIYFCSYCDFPTTDAFGGNPTSAMFNHIDYDCSKVTGDFHSIKFRTCDDAEFIKQYCSLTKGVYADAKICRTCDEIFGTEQLVMAHCLEKHFDLQSYINDMGTLKEISKNPSAYLADSKNEYYDLENKKIEYIDSEKTCLEPVIRGAMEERNDLVSFCDYWLLKDMLVRVDINEIAEKLAQHPEGLATSKLVELIFTEIGENDIHKKGIHRFSICYQLHRNGNFTYTLENDKWNIKTDILEDSPEDNEGYLAGRRSPAPRVGSKIKLEDEEIPPDAIERDDLKEMDMDTWRRIKKDEISYVLFFAYMYRGFLPYDKKAQSLFPPKVKRVYFITNDGKKISVKIDRNKKAVYSSKLKDFFQDSIAGTIVYLKRLNSDRNYGIYFRENPRIVKDCRVAIYDGLTKEVIYERKDLEVKYECVEPIFKAELRFQDIKALWEEAKKCGYSISDLVYLEFSKLAKEIPNKTAHFYDIYARVFFRRMCSPGGVWNILKKYPSYYEYKKNKFWMFKGEEEQKQSQKQLEIIHTVPAMKKHSKIGYIVITIIILSFLLYMFIKFSR